MREIIYAFIIGFVMTACSQHHTGMTAAKQRRCEPVLIEILQVQDLRALNNHALQHKRAEGTLTDEDAESWRVVEHELGSRAAHLYKVAERRKCFDEVEEMFLTSS